MDTNPEALAHLNLGKRLQSQLRFDEATGSYRAALALDPALAEASFRLGIILQKLRKWDEAAACYLAVLRVKPDSAETFNNLGAVYKSQGRLAEAIKCFQQGLQYRPDYVDVLANLGEVFAMQGRRAESMICYEQSLRMRPDFAQAHWNRALALLAEGDFEEGWPEYEWRWECPDLPRQALTEPEWDGGPLDGRVLLVHAEQGLGDTLQFVRYLPLLAGLGGPLVLRVQAPLVPLLTQSGFQNLFAVGAPLPHYDFQIPLLSLPGKLGTTVGTIPAQVPYLAADPGLVSHWRDALSDVAGLKVGIAWQGSAEHQTDHLRSVPLGAVCALGTAGRQPDQLAKRTGQRAIGRRAVSGARFWRPTRQPARRAHGHRRDHVEPRPGSNV